MEGRHRSGIVSKEEYRYIWYNRVNLSAEIYIYKSINLAYRFDIKQKWKIIYIENDLIKHLCCLMRAKWYIIWHQIFGNIWKKWKLRGPKHMHTFSTCMRERERGGAGKGGVCCFYQVRECLLMFLNVLSNNLESFILFFYSCISHEKIWLSFLFLKYNKFE